MSNGMKRVMIVDDEPTLAETLKALLEFKGYEVETARSGDEALNKLRFQRCSVILLDIMMPGLDGYQFMQQLRADTMIRETPVIVMTAIPNVRGGRRMESLGVVAYLEKPFENDKLVAAIEMAAAKPRTPPLPAKAPPADDKKNN